MTSKKLILILGGARSGKSQYAIELARKMKGRTVFLATLEFKDEEMEERIKKHRQARPPAWQTVEEGKNIENILLNLKGLCNVVIIDCLTNLVSNLLLDLSRTEKHSEKLRRDPEVTPPGQVHSGKDEEKVVDRIEGIMRVIDEVDFTVLMVANEVGSGIVPDTALGRKFRDVAGKANQLAAKYADEVYLMTAGIPLKVKEKTDGTNQ